MKERQSGLSNTDNGGVVVCVGPELGSLLKYAIAKQSEVWKTDDDDDGGVVAMDHSQGEMSQEIKVILRREALSLIGRQMRGAYGVRLLVCGTACVCSC